MQVPAEIIKLKYLRENIYCILLKMHLYFCIQSERIRSNSLTLSGSSIIIA
jgi:hypothetical protein